MMDMKLVFEWDIHKALKNFEKHNISFEEATTVFGDANSVTIEDPNHSIYEKRFIILGHSERNRLISVVFTERGKQIRIISSRPASRKERKQYNEKEK